MLMHCEKQTKGNLKKLKHTWSIYLYKFILNEIVTYNQEVYNKIQFICLQPQNLHCNFNVLHFITF